MQSEHMKKLLFPIYSLFFFLWTLDAGKTMAAVGEVTREVAGLFVGEEQAKVEVHRSTRWAGSRPDDAVARPRLAGLGNTKLRRTGLRCSERRGATSGHGGWLWLAAAGRAA